MIERGDIVVFADDTTGALDVAGSLYSRGITTSVNMSREGQISGEQCTVWNLNSRYVGSAESTDNLRLAYEEARSDSDEPQILVKVDSTLRGNVISDSKTVSGLAPKRPVFIAPAFPFYGRTCVDGEYYVGGRRVDETEFANDRAFGFESSRLDDNDPDIRHVDWRVLHRGVGAVIEEVDNSEAQIFSFDSRDQTDLELIANVGLQLNASMVGSSGLARAVPRQRATETADSFIEPLPALFVVGSINPTSRAQKEELSITGVNGFDLTRRDIGNTRMLDAVRGQIQELLAQEQPVYLSTPDEITSDEAYWIEIEESIGQATNIDSLGHNLVIVGGETARATFRSRGVENLTVRGEYEPGIPITSVSETPEAILTKAGGFGYSNTLVDIHNYMRGRA